MHLNRIIASAVAVLVLGTAACTEDSPAEQKPYPEEPVGIVPPAEHPRLYIRESGIPALKAKMQTAEGQRILSKMRANAVPRTEAEEAAITERGYSYYFEMRGLTSEVQLEALEFLTENNATAARHAVTAFLDSLKHTNFGTQNDLSRASGVMLMTGAIIYDWCYYLMSAQEKQQYIDEFVRIAGTMECRYPPKRTEPIAGHGSEWMILRDMLSCGIAVYDEYPDMYNYVIEMLTEDYFDARNYFYAGHNYHQGTSYTNVRMTADLISAWILKTMGYASVYSEDQRQVLYDMIYRRRPDNLLLPAGDVNPAKRGNVPHYTQPAMLAASLYSDPYLAYEYERRPTGVENHCLILELLWRDFDLRAKKPDDLPLTHYSGTPFGSMIARTGWDENSVIAEMKINEHFVGNHQHQDGGSFQIYYKGPLAIDSGTYQGTSGGYNSPHCKNYFKRTIAHNSLLIYDPDELFDTHNYGGEGQTPYARNDGGQRLPGDGWNTCRSFKSLLSDEYTVGKVLGQEIGVNYSYLKGDITKAYSSKVSDVRRSFVFIDTQDSIIPAMMVIYDNIVSANPEFKKYYLLHSIEKPTLGAGKKIPYFEVARTKDNDSGMLRDYVLMPDKKNLEMEAVGGPGKEFDVFGENFPNDRNDPANERGAWRVQLSPKSASAQDNFLNVIQVADNDCYQFNDVRRIDCEKVVGAEAGKFIVFFSRNLGTLDSSFEIKIDGRKNCTVLLTDLSAGRWQVKSSGREICTAEVSAESGTLNFEAAGGTFTVSKIN